MREVVVTKKNINTFYISDWKNIPELLENIDKELKSHDLELVMGSNWDDDYYVKVAKRHTT